MTWANLDKNGQHCESVQICDDPTKFQARLRIVENCEGGSHLGSNRTFVRWDIFSTRESFKNIHFRSLSVGDGSYNLGAPGGPNSHNASDAGLAKDFPPIWEVLQRFWEVFPKILRGLAKDFPPICGELSILSFLSQLRAFSCLGRGRSLPRITRYQSPTTNHQVPPQTTIQNHFFAIILQHR